MINYDSERKLEIPYGLGNVPVAVAEYVPARYDLILFNNATKKTYIFEKVPDAGNGMYYELAGFDPGDIPTGEYSYALIYNALSGVQYTPKNSLLGTELTYNGRTYQLEELSPETGILKYIGEGVEDNAEYRDTEKEFYYRKK